MTSSVTIDVQNKLKALVEKHLGVFDPSVIEIKSSIDSIGEEIINIDVKLGNSIQKFLAKTHFNMVLETFDVLNEAGEDRYPFYHYRFHPDQVFQAA